MGMAFFYHPPALDAFVAPARPRAALWRLGLGITIFAAVILALAAGFGLISLFLLGLSETAIGDAFFGGDPSGVLIGLATFILWWPALWLALRLAHRRGFSQIFGPSGRVSARRFGRGAGIAAILAGGAILTAAALTGAPERSGLPVTDWALFALLALPLIFIQSAAEELVFRGYLLQTLGARFGHILAWGVIPSVLFGVLHWSPAGGALDGILTVLITGLSGFAFAVITARSGDLSLAMGLHFGLNAVTLIFAAPAGPLDGIALTRWTGPQTPLLALDLAILLAVLAAAALWARRR